MGIKDAGRRTIGVVGSSVLESILVYGAGDRGAARKPLTSSAQYFGPCGVREGVIAGVRILLVLRSRSAADAA